MRYAFIMLLTMLCCTAGAQKLPVPPKEVKATRIHSSITIDGELKEPAWKTAPVITGFSEFRPSFGRPETPQDRTEAYFLFDDFALYVGGYCHIPKDSISKELVGRDQINANDFFAVFIDTYHDKMNAVGFFVTPLGEQYDARYAPNPTGNNEDGTWNAVWTSECKIHDDGWTFEIRIPYSAIRFSPKNSTWGMNMMRSNKKSGRDFFWNPLDQNVNGMVNQFGIVTGLTDIKPPLRLSFTPYLSTYVNHFPYDTKDVKNTTASVNGGADVKYGINQNFTLDMTLIPDFGQVASDKTVLNLTPFEVQYVDNRPFFTEGTDLFTKGNLFYSRRIGGEPINKYNITGLGPNEEVIDNPSQSKLINAIKVSGRNAHGTGLGFFNAVTNSMYATILDSVTGKTRKYETGPLTNYNIMVVDQSLKYNSSVSFINTNVMRNGTAPDANVNALSYNLNNKKNMFSLFGSHSLSSISQNAKTVNGYYQNIGAGKVGGALNFQLWEELTNDKYNKNDMGIMNFNNYMTHGFWIGYKLLKPKSFYNNLYLNFETDITHRFTDKHYETLNFSSNINGTLKNLWRVSLFSSVAPDGYDFYEPRVDGWYFKYLFHTSSGLYVASNQAKKYWASLRLNFGTSKLFASKRWVAEVFQYYKFNDKFSVNSDISYSYAHNDAGYAAIDSSNNDIIFGRRNRYTMDNNLGFKYNFTKRMGMSMNIRHYWSQVPILQYFTLQSNGLLQANKTYQENNNINVNLFNIDYMYFWELRPGSFLNIVWKNAINNSGTDVSDGYFRNFDRTIGYKQNNYFSIKLLYYLDYQELKKSLHAARSGVSPAARDEQVKIGKL